MDKHDVLLVHGIFGISRNCVLRRKGVAVIPCLGCSNFRCGIHDAGASDSAEGPACCAGESNGMFSKRNGSLTTVFWR